MSSGEVHTGTMSVGAAVISLISSHGIDTVFGIPGTHNLEFYRGVQTLGLRAVTARHEQGAGYAADAWSQRTGKPGVVITTSGPGLLNVLSAAGTAFCESRPLLVLSPGAARGDEFADRGTLHETKDASAAAGSVMEWSRRVQNLEEALGAVHDAFELFDRARPRPVHIEVPLDLLEEWGDIPDERLRPCPLPPLLDLEVEALEDAAELLRRSESTVIVAGGGSTGAATELVSLAELLGSVVVTTLNGKGTVPESHPLSVGSELRLATGRRLVNEADVVLIVGAKLGEAELWGGTLEPIGRVIRIDISDQQLEKNVPADVTILGDAQRVVTALLARLEGVEGRAASSALVQLRADLEAEAAAFAPDEYAVARRIVSAIPDGAIVTGDSSQIVYYGLTSALKNDEPHELLYMPAYATLGYGLPAAVGAAIASPEKDVVCVLGDGALMFSIQELATAVEQQLSLTIVCVDNGGYAEIKQNEADAGIAPIGVDLHQPDWALLAQAFGGNGHSVSESSELEATIKAAVLETGVSVVHVPMATAIKAEHEGYGENL